MSIWRKTPALTLAAAFAAAFLVSGCGGGTPKAMPDCPKLFDFSAVHEPLGDARGLRRSARTLALGPGPVTMREVTEGAGLKGDWDRMVVVFPGTKIADLNSYVGTTTYCWKDLPPIYGDDTPHTAYYLFVRANEPVQAVSWFYPNDRELDFMTSRTTVVLPDTLLRPAGVNGPEPYLRPVVE